MVSVLYGLSEGLPFMRSTCHEINSIFWCWKFLTLSYMLWTQISTKPACQHTSNLGIPASTTTWFDGGCSIWPVYIEPVLRKWEKASNYIFHNKSRLENNTLEQGLLKSISKLACIYSSLKPAKQILMCMRYMDITFMHCVSAQVKSWLFCKL